VEDRLLYRVTEVAVFLSVSRSKVYELLASGDLRSVKIDRTRLVRGSDLRDSGAMCCGARRHLGAGQRVQPLKADAAELRAALVWAAGPDGSSLALRLIGCLWHFCELVGDVDEPGQIAESVITRLSDSRPGSLALRSVVPRPCASYEAARPRAVALHSRALQAFRDVGDQEGVAWSEVCLAVQAIEQGDPTKAREFAKPHSPITGPRYGPRPLPASPWGASRSMTLSTTTPRLGTAKVSISHGRPGITGCLVSPCSTSPTVGSAPTTTPTPKLCWATRLQPAPAPAPES
jgi:excisionase family DNA binding protein